MKLRRDPQPPTVRLTDGLLKAIHEQLATRPPELGGALMGFGDTAYYLVEDDHGVYSSASYDISAELTTAIGKLEDAGRGRLMGTVHTHPDYVKDPSGRDVTTMGHALEMNPHLESLLVCIVTRNASRPTDIPVGPNHSMAVHIMQRTPSGPKMRRALAVIVPLAADLAEAGLPLRSGTTVKETLKSPPHDIAPSVRANGADKLLIRTDTPTAFLIDAHHPTTPPTVMTANDEHLQAEDTTWDRGLSLGPQMARVLKTLTPPPAERTPPEDQYARVRDLTGSALETAAVIVAGAGSVGSRVAEDLIRAGVLTITLIDPDVVTPPNLARSVYTTTDLGHPKVTALADRLRGIAPSVNVICMQTTLDTLDTDTLLTDCNLLVLATDDMPQQALLAATAYQKRVPHVACALYRQAAAGEVVVVLPNLGTACWACCVGTNTVSTENRADVNYGVSTRLVAESGLGPSINLVSSLASLAAIGLLAGPSSYAGQQWRHLIEDQRTMGIITTTPGWGFFPDLIGQSHQSHPQSAWPRLERQPHCPICGQPPTDMLTGDTISFADLVDQDEAHQPQNVAAVMDSPTAPPDDSLTGQAISFADLVEQTAAQPPQVVTECESDSFEDPENAPTGVDSPTSLVPGQPLNEPPSVTETRTQQDNDERHGQS